MSKYLLIVAHAPSPNTRLITEAVLRGANHPDIEGVRVRWIPPLDATAEDVLKADGLILGTTENFAYMSGAMKDFFDRIYYPCLEVKQGLPYGLFIRAGNDGQGAKNSVEKIVTGLRWNAVQEPLVMRGKFQDSFVADSEELGMTVAAGMEAGIF
ncbi:flavodoxin family protein [Motiliproteus sp. MSK22-1]|uniref:flavodoxin family protein n=1 Tax=Motiliproteus sp. MSK22-1 TaxID=1897630 RepID=UPI00097639DA|nr:NAD(P)H-dependent oxidoreductase [Motiliproteus sp. MSK22-1]OMH26641.1 flavodoxin [Motiliproteus sp. MSK22-1]